jgi:hypothetical protein
VTQEKIKEFDDFIHCHFQHNVLNIDNVDADHLGNVINDVHVPYDEDVVMPEDDDYPDEDTFDQYLSAQVLLPCSDTYEKATVKSRKCDNEGNLIGKSNSNPILDTRIYNVQFQDGTVSEYSTNVIAKNIFAMADDDRYEILLFDDIIDHTFDPNIIVSPEDSWIKGHNGNLSPK